MLPLSFTRPVAEFRTGIFTTRERWEFLLKGKASFISSEFLSEAFPINVEEDNLVINSAVLPNDRLVRLFQQMEPNEAFMSNNQLIAARLNADQLQNLFTEDSIEEIAGIDLEDTPFIQLLHPWDIFQSLRTTIEYDFELLTKGRTSRPIHSSNQVLDQDNVFIEEGAQVQCAILNAQSGPIYIGKNAQVMEGSILRGPVVVGEGSIIKMGARVYGPTLIGPGCRVGGELKEVVMFGNSNKAHDGYLGNSIIGEWCNLGAGTSVSNLKNNYSNVKMWDYQSRSMKDTGILNLGLIMGDHSKCGIQTMFNTGTTVGVAANVFGAGYPPKFIPSFSWGGPDSLVTYRLNDAIDTARRVMGRRSKTLSPVQEGILKHVFDVTSSLREE